MILDTGYEYSWFITTQKIIKKEFALSGSEQNPDFEQKSWKEVIKQRILNKKATPAVEAFKDHGENFVVADTLPELIAKMNGMEGNDLLPVDKITAEIEARDANVITHLPRARRLWRSTRPEIIAETNFSGPRNCIKYLIQPMARSLG